MSQAFGVDPVDDGDLLVFDDGTVRLVYEPYVDPEPADLFAVLGDTAARVDSSALPPEQATGSVPPSFDVLVPLPSASDEVDLFLATRDDLVCLVAGLASATTLECDPPRVAEATTLATDIPYLTQPIVRVALIPDRFAAAAASRTDLGTYESNLLTVAADAPEGAHVLTSDDGEEFVLQIPGPWIDRLAAPPTTAALP